ncbi:UNVERIFIED_CONTAM: hypothetical protein Sradi_7145600 [Sesamum radiatum]|uniref:CCHC-type domain-containing protein n=1 Tax=Sesamum radiatum TaxID=300843 RepID=A0AAW2IWA0_SESRA
MKEVYAVPDRHIRYAATKAFFGTKMTEGSSVREHEIKMLSLVEKLEDLQTRLDNDTYIDVILQSLPPSYDPFVVNYNMNGLEKSINELINMLVQYETTTKKSEPSVLVGEASTSKAKGKGARRWKRKKGKAKAAASALSAPVAPVGMGKGKGKVGSKPNKANDVCIHCREKGHWKRECPKLLSSAGTFVIEVLERSRKLSRDEVVLKLSDGKAVAAEAVGIVHLVVSDQVMIELKDCYYVPSMIKNIISISLLDNHYLIMTAQNKRKMDNQDNAQIWHARLGHISQDRIKREDDQEALCGTKYACQRSVGFDPFRRLWATEYTSQRWVFLFITFIDDHSRYGYVYVMRYKSEAFGRFKEFRLEVENQTGRKIKTLRSDRGGLLLERHNCVSERRNRTLLDMARSMMNFTELSLSFWDYALEMAAKLLNMEPSKTVAQTPYQIWHGKPASYKYLRVWGSPAYVKRLVGETN